MMFNRSAVNGMRVRSVLALPGNWRPDRKTDGNHISGDEGNDDIRLRFQRLTISVIGEVTPLPDRSNRCCGQGLVAIQDLHFFYRAVVTNDRFERDFAMNA